MFILVFSNAIAISFTKLGLSASQTFIIFFAAILGSYINIPLSRRKVMVLDDKRMPFPIFRTPPRVAEQIILVNVGGAIIPLLLCLYLLPKAPLAETIFATIIITIASKLLARPVPGVGITMPALIPPLLTALIAMLISPQNPTPVAYISGVLGVLIGADLLNLRRIRRMGPLAMSIGGAGLFDGIFLVGIFSALLS